MASVEKVKSTATDWLHGLVADLYDKRIVKLVQHLDKCLNWNGDYVENEHTLYLVVTLKVFGWIKFSFVLNKTVLTLKITLIFSSRTVEALCYKLECHWFGSQCHWIFKSTQFLQLQRGPGVDSASNGNEYQESSWDKGWPAHKAGNITAMCELTV
jgi:hypothetical protein